MSEEKKLVQFYGGSIGPWVPTIAMIVGMIVGTIIGGGGMVRFGIITFIAVVIGFFLCKEKKEFSNIAFKGLQNNMLSIIIVAFLLAGVLSQLLRQSGLIDSLIWVASEFHVNTGFIPLVAFVICALISTACGTSSGSVTAVAPILIPMAVQMNCNVGLVCGAIISGAIFGDNLAPISDTTIASALTQGAEIKDVVRTRLPYSLIAGGIAAVLFIVFGMSQEGTGVINITSEAGPIPLILLALPVIMIIMMKMGKDLITTLIVCDVLGIIINLVCGNITLANMFLNEGPIGGGMVNMLNMILYCMLLFIVLEILNASGAFKRMINSLEKICKTPRSGELAGMLTSAISTLAAGGSSPAVVFVGPMFKNITKKFGIMKARGGNILDATACGVSGLLPYGTGCMLCLTFAADVEGISPTFSFMDIIPYSFHSMLLLVVFFLSIVTGIGRKFEDRSKEDQEVA